MRTIDAATGHVWEDDAYGNAGSSLGAANQSAPAAPAIASFLGVPVTWVLIAGAVLLVVSALTKRGR